MRIRVGRNVIAALAAALLATASADPQDDASDGAILRPEEIQSIGAADAAKAAAQRRMQECAEERANLRMLLDNPEAIILPAETGVQVIMPKHIDELIARVRLLNLIKPELLSSSKGAIAAGAGVPEETIDMLLESDGLFDGAAAAAVSAALREKLKDLISAGRGLLEAQIATCLFIEEAGITYQRLVEERRKQLETTPPGEDIVYEGEALMIGGAPVHVCIQPGDAPFEGEVYPCEKFVADRFCQSKGHGGSRSSKWTYGDRAAYLNGGLCERGNFQCEHFTIIVCFPTEAEN